MQELGQHLNKHGIFAMVDMVYFGHEAYCSLNDKENKYSLTEATTWIEDITEEQLAELGDRIMDIKLFGKSIKENVDAKGKAAAAAKKKNAK